MTKPLVFAEAAMRLCDIRVRTGQLCELKSGNRPTTYVISGYDYCVLLTFLVYILTFWYEIEV